MSYGFAGALQGLGGGMMKLADERRQLANDLLKMEKKAVLDKDVAESRAASTARHRRGRGRGGGSGGAGRGGSRRLSNQESDNLGRLYESYIERGAFDGEPPSLGEFESRIEMHIRDAGSLASAAELARSEWGGKEVTNTIQHERAALSPARLWDDDGKYEETATETEYGFNSALGEAPSPSAADASPARSQTAPQRSSPPQSPPKSEQALTEARVAIASGADRNAVISRLQEMGIDPKGL